MQQGFAGLHGVTHIRQPLISEVFALYVAFAVGSSDAGTCVLSLTSLDEKSTTSVLEQTPQLYIAIPSPEIRLSPGFGDDERGYRRFRRIGPWFSEGGRSCDVDAS